MKRSELNGIIGSEIVFMNGRRVPLPPFAYWKKADWAAAGPEYQEIVDNMLGWDITDFGSNDFTKVGLLLAPGESVTLLPGQYHQLVGEPGTGQVRTSSPHSSSSRTMSGMSVHRR